MDPMLEIARGFLRSEREAGNKIPQVINNKAAKDTLRNNKAAKGTVTPNARYPCTFPEKINKDIRERIEKLNSEDTRTQAEPDFQHETRLSLWDSRDERALEILADVFYVDPDLARQVCEIRSELVPEFIHYLADETRRQWDIEKSGAGPNQSEERLGVLFKGFGYGIHETFPDGLELALIGNPRFMEELADRLKVALPFSLVLKKEIQAISRSKNVRLCPDPGAEIAKRMDDVLRIQSRLARLEKAGNREIISGEKVRLKKHEKKLKILIDEAKPRSDFDATEEKTVRGITAVRPPSLHGKKVANVGPMDEEDKPQDTNLRFPPIQAEAASHFGLALSGGGIRSATFNLGILQGLGDLDLLRRLDYLSGVSGGSHIAAWLGAWIKREPEGIRRVQRWLSSLRSPTPDTEENHPIQFLRRFSNYLAPRRGILSADTWSVFTIWLRNTLLNQIVLILLLSSLLTAPKLIFALYRQPWYTGTSGRWISALTIFLMTGLAVLIGLNLRHFDPKMPSRLDPKRDPFILWTQFRVQMTLVVGFVVMGSFAAVLLFDNRNRLPTDWLVPTLALCVALWIAHLTSGSWRLFLSQRPGEPPILAREMGAITAGLFISAVSTFVGGAVLRAVLNYPGAARSRDMVPSADVAKIVIFGPEVVFGILGLVVLVQIGLMGRNLPDNRREWWGRLGATLLITLGLWVVLSAGSLWGPALAMSLLAHTHDTKGIIEIYLPTALWLAITALGSKWGFSGDTPPHSTDKSPLGASLGRILRTTPRQWIAVVAPYVYIAGLGVLLSFLLYAIPLRLSIFGKPLIYIFAKPPAEGKWNGNWNFTGIVDKEMYWNNLVGGPWFLPAFFLFMLTLAVLLAWRFDVNEFSMHGFYRNRLVRCFLGASRAQIRQPNPFTGFDSDDDMRISLLRDDPPVPKDLSRAARRYHGPFLIFNTTLNLVAGKELAWQERKAASFVFTPLYCGYELANGAAYRQSNYAGFGYRRTEDYAERDLLGPSLGTAMAISGAAANPNMGYHYSPAVSFLMALFNVRLGCWMGNPRHRKTWAQASPICGLAYLANELIGITNDTSRFVNLSDGGHFDNLGIYELVRRHCMYIIVCDAEEDLPFSFQGLSNAIRKCRADFGIDIRLDPDQLRPVQNFGKEQGESRTHCAIGDVVYGPGRIGKMLYIKTSLTGDEPGDVLGYKLRYPSFPHQSTFNQFFNESQFESYRALGQHIAMAILQRASEYAEDDLASDPPNPSLSDLNENKKFLSELFVRLNAMWYPPSANMVALRDRHRELYDKLIDMFQSRGGQDKDLDAASKTFFQTTENTQGAFLAYSQMIELMHRVFQDLDLETMADHPHNEGWMNIFRRWAKDPHFKKTWKAASRSYDSRFRTFCRKELDLFESKVMGESPQKPAAA
jgi:hypothetical protein